MNQISIWFSILARDVLMSAVRHCFFESCTVLVLEIGQWPHWGFLQITSSSVPPRMTVASSAASSSPCAPLLWHFISLCLPYNWDLVLNWNNPSTFVLRIQTARWDRIFSRKTFAAIVKPLELYDFPIEQEVSQWHRFCGFSAHLHPRSFIASSQPVRVKRAGENDVIILDRQGVSGEAA